MAQLASLYARLSHFMASIGKGYFVANFIEKIPSCCFSSRGSSGRVDSNSAENRNYRKNPLTFPALVPQKIIFFFHFCFLSCIVAVLNNCDSHGVAQLATHGKAIPLAFGQRRNRSSGKLLVELAILSIARNGVVKRKLFPTNLLANSVSPLSCVSHFRFSFFFCFFLALFSF